MMANSETTKGNNQVLAQVDESNNEKQCEDKVEIKRQHSDFEENTDNSTEHKLEESDEEQHSAYTKGSQIKDVTLEAGEGMIEDKPQSKEERKRKHNDFEESIDNNSEHELEESEEEQHPANTKGSEINDLALEAAKKGNEDNPQSKEERERKHNDFEENTDNNMEHEVEKSEEEQHPANTKGSEINDVALEAGEEGIEDNPQSKEERERKHNDFEENTDNNMEHEINKQLNKSDDVKENIEVHSAEEEHSYGNLPTKKESSTKQDDFEDDFVENTENDMHGFEKEESPEKKLSDTPEREVNENMRYSDLAHRTDEELIKNNPSNSIEENSMDNNLEEKKVDAIVLGLEKKSDQDIQSTDKEEKREDKKHINNKNISKTNGDDSGIYSEETIEQDTAIGLENESNVENLPTQAEKTETQADLKKDKDTTGKKKTLREERLTQDALAEELSKYEMKNKELTDTLRDANNEIERFESDLEKKNEIIRTREEEIEDLNRRLEDQNHTHADLLHRIIAAEKSAGRLSASEESNRNMEKKQRELEQEKEKLHKELQETNRTIQVLQSQNQQCKNDFQANNLKLENLRKESAQKEATNKTALEMIKQEKEKLQNELLGRNSIIQGLQSENQRSKRDLDATAMENAQLKGKLSDMQTTVTQLKAYLEKTEATKTSAIESMQKAITERDHMTIQMGTLQTLKMEKENLHRNYELILEQNTKLNASVQEYGLLQNHIQEYYKAWQESQMELHTEREKNRHFNELFSKNGHRMSSMITDIQNYRRMADDNRRLLEEKKEECHRKERELDRLKSGN
uniref:Myb-like protein X n=1 Tax=Crassostrea virginica TaxID=6565 RepID=A0A8B8AQ92_CRAVI|nr:myb-like protein X [Crassostrea virginica]